MCLILHCFIWIPWCGVDYSFIWIPLEDLYYSVLRFWFVCESVLCVRTYCILLLFVFGFICPSRIINKDRCCNAEMINKDRNINFP
jgi:hypothetical protein